MADDPSQTANSDLTGSDGSPPDGERTLRHLLSIMRITNVTKLSNGSEEIEEICTRPGKHKYFRCSVQRPRHSQLECINRQRDLCNLQG